MCAKEGFLPVEFVSRSLSATTRLAFQKAKKTKSAGDSHLVQVCARFRGYAFEDLHPLNEKLTISLDLSRIGTILPGHADGRVDQAFSPSRIEACGVGVHTGYFSASDEAMSKFSGIVPVPGIMGELTSTRTHGASTVLQLALRVYRSRRRPSVAAKMKPQLGRRPANRRCRQATRH